MNPHKYQSSNNDIHIVLCHWFSKIFQKSEFASIKSSMNLQNVTFDFPGGSMGEADMPNIVHYNRDRRRSSFTRPMRDPEEILEGLRSLKAAKRELGRTMSLTGDKRRESREYGYVASLLAIISPNHSFVRPSVRSFIHAIVCLSVRLSISVWLSFTRSSIYFYILSSLSLLFSHHHCSRSLDRRSARSILVHQPISRSNLPRRPAPCVSYACE